jgi:hypothetical protein
MPTSLPLDSRTKASAAAALVSVLLLRSRLVHAPQDVVKAAFRKSGTRENASAEEVEKALRTGYLEQEDGSKVLLIPHGGRVAKASLLRCSQTIR